MNSPPDVLPLAELQARFAAALHASATQPDGRAAALAECIVDDGLAPAARVQVYRNNVRAMFEGALAADLSGAQAARGRRLFRETRGGVPAGSPVARAATCTGSAGDSPNGSASRMAGTDYAWLADLARLEWACEEVLVSEWLATGAGRVAGTRASRTPRGHPAVAAARLRTVASAFPVWSVWQANQPGARGDAIDPSLGPQRVVVAPDADGLVLHSLAAEQFGFVEQLAAGRTLGQALEASAPRRSSSSPRRWRGSLARAS